MKIFGHYLFEDDPELIEARQFEEQGHRQAVANSCENHDKGERDLCLMNFRLSTPENALEGHREYVKKKECHIYLNKKYCYHTGKEIVTDCRK